MKEAINFEFMRSKKAEELKEWHNKLTEKDSLLVEKCNNAILLPVKKFKGDNLLFGRGGCASEKGDYIASSGLYSSIPHTQDRISFRLFG